MKKIGGPLTVQIEDADASPEGSVLNNLRSPTSVQSRRTARGGTVVKKKKQKILTKRSSLDREASVGSSLSRASKGSGSAMKNALLTP